jgi:hypothetical protein
MIPTGSLALAVTDSDLEGRAVAQAQAGGRGFGPAGPISDSEIVSRNRRLEEQGPEITGFSESFGRSPALGPRVCGTTFNATRKSGPKAGFPAAGAQLRQPQLQPGPAAATASTDPAVTRRNLKRWHSIVVNTNLKFPSLGCGPGGRDRNALRPSPGHAGCECRQ